MAQGGFARDYQRAAMARIKKEQEELNRSREIIGNDVVHKILPSLQGRVDVYMKEQTDRLEKGLVLKQDETIGEFIKITHDRNRLLKFLLWTNVITLLGLSFTLGYFL